MKHFLLILSLLLTACASAKNPIQMEMAIRPGEVRLLELEIPHENVKIYCRGKEVKFEKSSKVARGIVIESYFSDLKPFTCEIKEQDQVLTEIFFKVEAKKYKTEVLNVDMKTIKLSPRDQKRADEEQTILNRIYSSSAGKFLFKSSFQQPMNSVVTSVYGNKRIYNNHKHGQHLGIDYRAAIGEKVPAANSGRVMFAGDLFYTGHTVILDHGLEVFTVYGHLSKTLVEAGQFIERGSLIGLSGNSGRTSGPHLHWGVKVQGQYIDGLVLIEETKKVFRD